MQEELQQIIDSLDTSIPETIRILFDQGLGSWQVLGQTLLPAHVPLLSLSLFISFVIVYYHKETTAYAVVSQFLSETFGFSLSGSY